jgi:hypothetical protein
MQAYSSHVAVEAEQPGQPELQFEPRIDPAEPASLLGVPVVLGKLWSDIPALH